MSRLFNGFFVVTVLLLTSTHLPDVWLLKLCPLTDQFGRCVSLMEEQRRTGELSRLTRSSVERLNYKEKVSEALESGKMSLLEAAACFRTLYDDPKSWHHSFKPCPQHSDGEGWCREVIRWTEIRTRFIQSPYQADALRDRLETELQERLEHYGTVTLPE